MIYIKIYMKNILIIIHLIKDMKMFQFQWIYIEVNF